jgi:hypothetical protein
VEGRPIQVGLRCVYGSLSEKRFAAHVVRLSPRGLKGEEQMLAAGFGGIGIVGLVLIIVIVVVLFARR